MDKMLPIGTIVRVTRSSLAWTTRRTEIGKIVGYDMYGTKYCYNPQLYTDNMELWGTARCWAFPKEVEKLNESDI